MGTSFRQSCGPWSLSSSCPRLRTQERAAQCWDTALSRRPGTFTDAHTVSSYGQNYPSGTRPLDKATTEQGGDTQLQRGETTRNKLQVAGAETRQADKSALGATTKNPQVADEAMQEHKAPLTKTKPYARTEAETNGESPSSETRRRAQDCGHSTKRTNEEDETRNAGETDPERLQAVKAPDTEHQAPHKREKYAPGARSETHERGVRNQRATQGTRAPEETRTAEPEARAATATAQGQARSTQRAGEQVKTSPAARRKREGPQRRTQGPQPETSPSTHSTAQATPPCAEHSQKITEWPAQRYTHQHWQGVLVKRGTS